MNKNELIEQLAEKEYEDWSYWMKYLFSQCVTNKSGSVTILAYQVEDWTRRAGMPYAQLFDEEKQAVRNRVNLILPIIEAYKAPQNVIHCASDHENIAGSNFCQECGESLREDQDYSGIR